jgi:hypothetical protein
MIIHGRIRDGKHVNGHCPTLAEAEYPGWLRRLLTHRVPVAESVKLTKRAFDDEAASLPGDVPEDLVQVILAARPRSSS